jgi:Tol biopolymer transport system component
VSIPDTNGTSDVFVRDLQQGTTTLASVNYSGANSGNGISQTFGISPDGRFVLVLSEASDLVATDTNGVQDAFVRDVQTGRTALVSVNSTGTDSGNGLTAAAFLSADGRIVVFVSNATDLLPNGADGSFGVYKRPVQ